MNRKNECTRDNSGYHQVKESNCTITEDSWQPLLINEEEKEESTDCALFYSDVFFSGRMRKISLVMDCLGQADGQHGVYL